MKKTIALGLLFIVNCSSLQAQIYTPSGTIQGTTSNNNVGIGVISPIAKLTVQSSSADSNGGFKLLGFTYPNDINYWSESQFAMMYNGVFKNLITSNGISYFNGGNVGIGTVSPQTLFNVNVGAGGSNGVAGIRVGGLDNYSSIEFGIDGDYDGMIRSYGNNLNYYAGHWKIKGTIASENHSHNWFTSKVGSSDWSTVKMTLNQDGNLGIGTISPDEKLTVKGKIHTQEVRVDMQGALVPDYVFAKDYRLKTLPEVEAYIKKNNHLPEVPSANEIEKNGFLLAEMNMRLLKKVEELTLYLIEQNKVILEQNKRLEKLENK